MRTWTSKESAEKERQDGAVNIIAIDHATQGRVYIQSRSTMAVLQAALDRKPIPEIVKLVAEYPLPAPTPEVVEHHCDRCGKIVPETAYHQTEWTRFGVSKVKVIAYYCVSCAQLLHAVGAGEQTAMQDRAANVPSYEPTTKED